MEAYPHGEYVVLDGDQEELQHIARVLEDRDRREERETAAKIRRGLDRGATRIAVTRKRALLVAEALSHADDSEIRKTVEQALERLRDTDT